MTEIGQVSRRGQVEGAFGLIPSGHSRRPKYAENCPSLRCNLHRIECTFDIIEERHASSVRTTRRARCSTSGTPNQSSNNRIGLPTAQCVTCSSTAQPRNFPDVRLPRSAAMHLDGDNRSASFTAGLSVSIREFFSRLTQFFVSSGGLWSKLDFDCSAQLLRTCRDGFGFSDAVET
jgi:hypothetical protein